MEWIILNEFPSYEINKLGQVRNIKTGKILSQSLSPNGYYQINITNKCRRTHRLLAETFIKNPDNLETVNHIDGNKLNNNLSNLEWCTHGENIQHSYNLKNRSALGENNAKCKTNEKIVNEICIHLENGLKPSFIRDLGYDYNLIRAIKARKNWNHISNNYNF